MKVSGGYIARVEELPGAKTQVAMVLDANRTLSEQSLEGAEVIREP